MEALRVVRLRWAENRCVNNLLVLMPHSWVRTDMGQGFADAVGIKQPPLALEESVEKLLVQVSWGSVSLLPILIACRLME